jgi:hypothetical protein
MRDIDYLVKRGVLVKEPGGGRSQHKLCPNERWIGDRLSSFGGLIGIALALSGPL